MKLEVSVHNELIWSGDKRCFSILLDSGICVEQVKKPDEICECKIQISIKSEVDGTKSDRETFKCSNISSHYVIFH